MPNRYAMKLLSWLLIVLLAAPALAQQPRAEVSLLAGWTFSEGVDGDPVRAGDGNIYDRVDPKSSFKWGLGGGVLLGERPEVGFLFGRQQSTLKASGNNTVDVGDMNVDTYHGYFAYNFGDNDDVARPYVMGGLGVTHFGSVDFTLPNGQSGTIGATTRFSSTWGAGVKFYAPSVGVRFGVQWTPTFISSNAIGWSCGLFWGCYVVGDLQYANQFDVSGGITFRF